MSRIFSLIDVAAIAKMLLMTHIRCIQFLVKRSVSSDVIGDKYLTWPYLAVRYPRYKLSNTSQQSSVQLTVPYGNTTVDPALNKLGLMHPRI